MKVKPVWLIVSGIILLVAAGITYLLLSNPAPTPSGQAPQPSQTTPPTNEPSTEPQNTPTPGRYINYSASAVAAAQGRKILFFHAPWCPQCRALEQSIEQEGVPDGMTIFKVDYDTSTELKQRYGVTLQTTMVEIDNSGNIIKKHTAYDDPSLPAVLQALGE